MRTVAEEVTMLAGRLLMRRSREMWGECTLKDLGTWAAGTGFPLRHQGHKDMPYLFSKVSDMNRPGNEVYILSTENTINDQIAGAVRAKLHPKGTVIFPKIGGAIATNKRRILVRPTAIDNNLLGIIPNDSTSSEWLYHLIRGVDFAQYQSGTSVPALRQSVIGDIRVPLVPLEVQEVVARFLSWFSEREPGASWNDAPPLPSPVHEQRRIVALINELAAKIEEARGLRQEAAEDVDALVVASFRQLATTQSRNLGILGQGIIDARNGLSRRPSGTEEGPIVLRLADVSQGVVDLTNPRRGSMSDAEIEACRLYPGDLLFVRVNGSRNIVGRCIPFHGAPETVCFNDHLIRVRLNPEVFRWEFVALMANSPLAREYLESTAITTAGQWTINQKMLAAMPIPVPSVAQQQRIVGHFRDFQAKVGELRCLQAETGAELDAMLPSILDKAFKGEL